MENKKAGFVLAIVLLSIMLVVSLILGMTGFFCDFKSGTFSTDCKVGQISKVSVLPNQTSVLTLSFDDNFLPEEKIPITIQIENASLEHNVFVRVKSVVFGVKNVAEIKFLCKNNVVFEEDGYYYLQSVLDKGGKTTFCESLEIPQDLKGLESDKFVLSVVFECLEETQDVNLIWAKE